MQQHLAGVKQAFIYISHYYYYMVFPYRQDGIRSSGMSDLAKACGRTVYSSQHPFLMCMSTVKALAVFEGTVSVGGKMYTKPRHLFVSSTCWAWF